MSRVSAPKNTVAPWAWITNVTSGTLCAAGVAVIVSAPTEADSQGRSSRTCVNPAALAASAMPGPTKKGTSLCG